MAAVRFSGCWAFFLFCLLVPAARAADGPVVTGPDVVNAPPPAKSPDGAPAGTVIAPGSGPAATATADPDLEGKVRVAILPFKIQDSKPDDGVLAGAFSDTLTGALSQVKTLILVERSELASVLNEQAVCQTGVCDDKSAAQTGQMLGAEEVVLGTYTRLGNRVRANCRIVNAQTGVVDTAHAVQVDSQITKDEDLFDVMDALSLSLAKALGAPNIDEKEIAARTHPTSSFAAYTLYSKGRDAQISDDPGSSTEAAAYYQQALAADPEYALASASLSESYYSIANEKEEQGQDAAADYQQANSYAVQAVNLNPELWETHKAAALAASAGPAKDPAKAQQEADRAIQINPNHGDLYRVRWLARGAKADDGDIHRAIKLAPRRAAIWSAYATVLARQNRREEAAKAAAKAALLRPKRSGTVRNQDGAPAVRPVLQRPVDRAIERAAERREERINERVSGQRTGIPAARVLERRAERREERFEEKPDSGVRGQAARQAVPAEPVRTVSPSVRQEPPAENPQQVLRPGRQAVSPSTRREIHREVRQEVREKVQQPAHQGVRQETRREVREEVRQNVREKAWQAGRKDRR